MRREREFVVKRERDLNGGRGDEAVGEAVGSLEKSGEEGRERKRKERKKFK